ncbi:MAG: teichuronic acid biosynthesis glycosyltransferase TuaC [Planctomycetota bacterium]|jgi:teichuronic acid biosynthesis glycosyltransferase TuaC
MNIAVITSLFPSEPAPFQGVFAERRWLGMTARGHGIQVIQPVPHTPGPFARGHHKQIAAMAREEDRGVLVHRPRYWHWPGRALGNARRFAARALSELDALACSPDVVVCDYAWPASAVAPALRKRGIACVVNGRGSDVLEVCGEAGLGDELRSNLEAAGHWCAVSQDLVDAMDGLTGHAGHGVLVPNGVDTDLFQPRDQACARERLGLNTERPIVLVVGHLIPRKDPLLALKAFASGAPQDAQLVFVGAGSLAPHVQHNAMNYGLSERVRLAGERPPQELADWYTACDLLLLCSTREGRPNVVLEALASGRNVLATDAGGTAEILPEPRMLGTDRDPEVLGAQLADLLARPSSARELASSVAHLSWSRSLETLEECLQQARAGTGR